MTGDEVQQTFTCEACGETFDKVWTDEESRAEAEAVFAPEELAEVAVVCSPCLREMLAAMPGLAVRYRGSGA